MQVATRPASHSRVHAPSVLDEPSIVSANPAPIVVPLHPVWGSVPIGKDGCTLDGQSMWLLDSWHKRTTHLLLSLSESSQVADAAKQHEILANIQWDIFNAAQKADTSSGAAIATFLEMTVRHMEYNSAPDGSLEYLDMDWLKSLAAKLTKATAPHTIKKPVDKFHRDGKLTRAGLLHRYHAFLIGELQTLSWNLYGDRDYAMSSIPIDHEVTRWTSSYFKDGQPRENMRCGTNFPFFDESKLTTRARAVLSSLNINTTKPDR